jgi:RND family efflux transporter MFP subunit
MPLIPTRRYPLVLLMTVLSCAQGSVAADEPRGKIEAVHRTVVSSELSGRVNALPRRPGESFDQGDSLARIACSLYEAERDKVATQLAQARRKLDNKQRLADLESVGKMAVDLAELAVQEAEAELEIARLNVRRCDIKAPFAGRVVRLHASEYQNVQAQQKLLEIVGSTLEARVLVPADWLDWLEVGARLKLAVDETGTTVSGRVVRLGAVVDPVSQTVPVWARLNEAGRALRPGMSGTARFPGRPGGDEQGNGAGSRDGHDE